MDDKTSGVTLVNQLLGDQDYIEILRNEPKFRCFLSSILGYYDFKGQITEASKGCNLRIIHNIILHHPPPVGEDVDFPLADLIIENVH
jgi:hypothetical protein